MVIPPNTQVAVDELNGASLKDLLMPERPFVNVGTRELVSALSKILTPQELRVVRDYYGLGVDKKNTIEIGKARGFSGAYACMILVRAIERLKIPSNSRNLATLLDIGIDV